MARWALLVGDEAAGRALASKARADGGWDMTEARSGAATLALLQRESVDMLVTDAPMTRRLQVAAAWQSFEPRHPRPRIGVRPCQRFGTGMTRTPYTDALETILPTEGAIIQGIIATMEGDSMTVADRDGETVCASRAKSRELLTGEMQVVDSLPKFLRQGLLA